MYSFSPNTIIPLPPTLAMSYRMPTSTEHTQALSSHSTSTYVSVPTTVAHQFTCCLPSPSTSSQVFFYTPSSSSSSQATITYTSEVCPSTSLWSHSQSHSQSHSHSPSASLLPSTAMLQQTASISVLHHQQVKCGHHSTILDFIPQYYLHK